ncbi:caspase-8 isoform X2 [Hydra vulgaris]|uniref:Caspase-8 isoform X2 n=1 Tax=Hydra vulgaris TaxID=6087 RepID=A0ABM4BD21_HYDVU
MAKNSSGSSTIFSEYTLFLSKLADELTTYNLKKLKFLMKDFLPAGAIDKIDNAHCYIEILEKNQIIHKYDLRYLRTVFEAIGRNDLAKRVLTFINENAEFGKASELLSTKHNSLLSSNAEKPKISSDVYNQNTPLQYAFNQLSYNLRQDEEHIKEVQINNQDGIYAMESHPCGICLVIANNFFYEVESEDGRLLKSRFGTEKDVILLCNTFSWLNFEVVEHHNLEAQNILKVINDKKNMETIDCFVCCILSHGFKDGVYGSDGKKVTFQEMKTSINKSSTNWLLNKPKIFFIQADIMEEVLFSPFTRAERIPPKYSFLNETNPNESLDFCFSVATPTDKIDYHSSDGSWYVQTLCHILKEHSIRMSLTDMLQKLSNKISKIVAKTNGEVSVEEILSIHSNTLKKHLYFKPRGIYIDKTFKNMSIDDKKSSCT